MKYMSSRAYCSCWYRESELNDKPDGILKCRDFQGRLEPGNNSLFRVLHREILNATRHLSQTWPLPLCKHHAMTRFWSAVRSRAAFAVFSEQRRSPPR